ncbi:MAG TPA: PilX N-terminal domain-containing pilus assembly protein [Candidatus Methylomirabilis sp.]|nr:PilX N-terminal domain-containing pilus assembly protein [Candidatus Methylomirabilis sp.]
MKGHIDRTAVASAPHPVDGRQRGMALVFALVVLLILTILGVSSLRTSSLEQLMAGNTQEQTRALEAADSGLSRALHDMQNNAGSVDPTSFADNTQYTYQIQPGGGAENSTAVATAKMPALIQIGPAVRSGTPSGSNVCVAYYDQKVIGATNVTLAQENLHQGLTTGAPCPAAP